MVETKRNLKIIVKKIDLNGNEVLIQDSEQTIIMEDSKNGNDYK